MRLQQLTKVIVHFNPLKPNCRAAREFFQRASSPAARKSNPKCIVEANVRCDSVPPAVQVWYENGQREILPAANDTGQGLAKKISDKIERMELEALFKSAGEELPEWMKR